MLITGECGHRWIGFEGNGLFSAVQLDGIDMNGGDDEEFGDEILRSL